MLINLDLKDKNKSNAKLAEEESKESEEKSEKLEENAQNEESENSQNEGIDPEKKDILDKFSKNVDFLEDLEKEFMEIDKRDQIKNVEKEAKKTESTAINEGIIEDNDLENMLQELTLLVRVKE